MTSSLLHFRIINNFLDNNLIYSYYILFIFIVVVSTTLTYDYKIFAFDEATFNNFQNKVVGKIQQNNESVITNYPSSNITNLTNNNEDSIYGQIAAFENNVYIVWQESITETL